MKVIDLLNKIANGEEVPKKFKYRCDTYILNENELHSNLTYLNEKKDADDYNRYLFQDWIIDAILNEEVEIIEEEQDIEHYDYCDNPDVMTPSVIANNFKRLNEDLDIIAKAVNELKKNER